MRVALSGIFESLDFGKKRPAPGGSDSTAMEYNQIVPLFTSEHIRAYCDVICDQYAKRSDSSSTSHPILIPMQREAFAAVVMVDVSGYSKLTSHLSQEGPEGSAKLAKVMRSYLDKIIATILRNGADIVKFVGDALIFYWKIVGKVDYEDISEDANRGELVVNAAFCCMELLKNHGVHKIDLPNCAISELKIHLGIGAGIISDVHVGGGESGRWEHLIIGDAVNQISNVLDEAGAGELAMSHQSLKFFCHVMDINTVSISDYGKKCIILQGVEKARRKLPPGTPIEKISSRFISPPPENLEMYKKFVDRSALFKLQADINQSKLFRLDRGVDNLLNLYELRQVTTIFIKIGSLQMLETNNFLDLAQKAIIIVQTALTKCQGSLRQFHVDDKGAVILCFFGLPPLAHENDAVLGIRAAMEIKDNLGKIFNNFSMGVTTGVVSFGGVGGLGRAEYAVMGDSINMAARIMCHPDAKNSCLCDIKTFSLCDNEYTFDSLGVAKVKGKEMPISIFRPTDVIDKSEGNNSMMNKGDQVDLIGREKQVGLIKGLIDGLGTNQIAGLLMIEADGGQGLTKLSSFTKSQILPSGTYLLSGSGMETEKSTPYFAFRDIIKRLIDIIESATFDSKMGALRVLEKAPISSKIEKNMEITASGYIEVNTCNNSIKSVPGSPSMTQKSANRKASPLRLEIGSSVTSSIDDLVKRSESSKGTQRRYGLMKVVKYEDVMDRAFDIRVKKAFENFGESLDNMHLLNLILPLGLEDSPVSGQNNISPASRHKEFLDLVCRLMNGISVGQNIVILLQETQWMDNLSWNMLWSIANICPRVGILIFSRPERWIDVDEIRKVISKIKRMSRTKLDMMGGFTLSETKKWISAIWTGPPIKTVHAGLMQNIQKRTDGNPLYIKSLVEAWKESGQYSVSSDGVLNTKGADFDFGKLALGYDLKSIILSQFDRLDRNFQLFLKLASVLGQRFLLGDATYFFLDMPGFAEHISAESSLNSIARFITSKDKYSYLQLKTDMSGKTVYCQFKSAVVRSHVYALMVDEQRQKLHLLIAQYYESKLEHQATSDQPILQLNNSLVIQVYENYMASGEDNERKKLQYLQQVASLYYKKNSVFNAIRHYQLLIDQVRALELKTGESIYTPADISFWYRRLGEAYYSRNDYQHAEVALKESLKIIGYPFPSSAISLSWNLLQERAHRPELDNTFTSDMSVQSLNYDEMIGERTKDQRKKLNADFADGEEIRIGSTSSIALSNVVLDPSTQADQRERSSMSILSTLGNINTGGSHMSLGPFTDPPKLPKKNVHYSGDYLEGKKRTEESNSDKSMLSKSLGNLHAGNDNVPPLLIGLSMNNMNKKSDDIEDLKTKQRKRSTVQVVKVKKESFSYKQRPFSALSPTTAAKSSRRSSSYSLISVHPLNGERSEGSLLEGNLDVKDQHNMRMSLLTLALIYLHKENHLAHKYAVLKGLNISEKMEKNSIYALYLTLQGFNYHLEGREREASHYLKLAKLCDQGKDPARTAQILHYTARTYTYLGQFNLALQKLGHIVKLGLLAGDVSVRAEALKMESILYYHSGPQELSIKSAEKLRDLADQEEFWDWQFWGCICMLMNTIVSAKTNKETEELIKSLRSLWIAAPPDNISTSYFLLKQSAIAAAQSRLGLDLDYVEMASDLSKSLLEIKPNNLTAILAICHYGMVWSGLLMRGFVISESSGPAKMIPACKAAIKYLKSSKALSLSRTIRTIYKGLLLLLQKCPEQAVSKWRKALAPNEHHASLAMKTLLQHLLVRFTNQTPVSTSLPGTGNSLQELNLYND